MNSVCNEFQPSLSLFVDDELDDDGVALLTQHLDGCDHCQTELESLASTKSALAGLAVPMPETLRAQVLRSLDVEDKRALVQAKKSWLNQIFIPMSASITAVAAAALLFLLPTTSGNNPPVAAEVAKVVRRGAPMEVSGQKTPSWVREHFASEVSPPVVLAGFSGANEAAKPNLLSGLLPKKAPGVGNAAITLQGARLIEFHGYDAVFLEYGVDGEDSQRVQVVVVDKAAIRYEELQRVEVDGRILFKDKHLEQNAVVRNQDRYAVIFASDTVPMDKLLRLVSKARLEPDDCLDC